MKKQNKVYSASDFQGAEFSMLVEKSFWEVDSVDFTATGEYSKTPLFMLQLKRYVDASPAPEGKINRSAEMEPNRTYIVREGRPLYNHLAQIWLDSDGDREDFAYAVMKEYENGVFEGYVEALNGVCYTKITRGGTTIQKTRMECWYPYQLEPGRSLDDFILMCNRGVYTPIIQEKKDPLAGIDPAQLEALLAALKK